VVRVARNFVGTLDQLALMHKTTGAAPTFTDADIAAVRDEVIAEHDDALQFYSLFDLGRGDHVYDEVGMLRGELPDRCPPASGRAPTTCRQERFVSSDVRVARASINSAVAPSILLSGAMQSGEYEVQLDGRRVLSATMEAVLDPMRRLVHGRAARQRRRGARAAGARRQRRQAGRVAAR
jgi:hypothetical protein